MPDGNNRIRRNYWREIAAALAVIILFTVLFGRGEESAIELQFEDTQMSIHGPSGAPGPVTLNYADILSLSLRDSLDLGTFESGLNTESCQFGVWRGGELGSYTLCACPAASEYIVLETAEGTVAFNYQDDDATEHLCEALLELLESKGLEVSADVG